MADVMIRKSGIHAKGLFAARDFRKGEQVTHWHPRRILTKGQLRKLSVHDKNYVEYLGKGRYALMGSPENRINHSCDPNTFIRNLGDVALRDIKKGEEITSDYSVNSAASWSFGCSCKSKDCRKVVTGDFRKLEPRTKRRLRRYLAPWFREEFLRK